jgi:Flp pilus assembly protein TadG
MAALSFVVLIGFVGLALDVGMWYRTQRALQDAADAAVVAAAINGSSSYASEAKAVMAQYGFTDGTGNISITPSNNLTCPDGTSGCYKVIAAQTSAPIFFASVLGLSGPAISATAMANNGTHAYCLLALGNSSTTDGILVNGAPKADMNGCSIMSDTNATCHGHNLDATYGDAAGTNDGCGINEKHGVPTVADPYSSLLNSWETSTSFTNPCGGTYYTEPVKKKDPPLTNANNLKTGSVTWSNSPTLANGQIVCGDLKLTNNLTVTSSAGLGGAVLVIENGVLDTNGYTLATASGSALTIIFTGSATGYNHYPTDNGGSGVLNITAPTSGTWKGIALYQDPNLTDPGISFTYAGNSPTWDITGTVYFPNATIQFKGAINKSAYGASCLLFVVGSIVISGTADIEQTTAATCRTAGVTLPTDNVGAVSLVM